MSGARYPWGMTVDPVADASTGRGQDSAEVIDKRMHQAQAEIAHWHEFDFLVINDDFDAALDDLHSIVRYGRAVRQEQEERNASLLAELLETG